MKLTHSTRKSVRFNDVVDIVVLIYLTSIRVCHMTPFEIISRYSDICFVLFCWIQWISWFSSSVDSPGDILIHFCQVVSHHIHLFWKTISCLLLWWLFNWLSMLIKNFRLCRMKRCTIAKDGFTGSCQVAGWQQTSCWRNIVISAMARSWFERVIRSSATSVCRFGLLQKHSHFSFSEQLTKLLNFISFCCRSIVPNFHF